MLLAIEGLLKAEGLAQAAAGAHQDQVLGLVAAAGGRQVANGPVGVSRTREGRQLSATVAEATICREIALPDRRSREIGRTEGGEEPSLEKLRLENELRRFRKRISMTPDLPPSLEGLEQITASGSLTPEPHAI